MRRKQIKDLDPGTSQKAINSMVKLEWEAHPDKELFRAQARANYRDFKELRQVWSRMESKKAHEDKLLLN